MRSARLEVNYGHYENIEEGPSPSPSHLGRLKESFLDEVVSDLTLEGQIKEQYVRGIRGENLAHWEWMGGDKVWVGRAKIWG